MPQLNEGEGGAWAAALAYRGLNENPRTFFIVGFMLALELPYLFLNAAYLIYATCSRTTTTREAAPPKTLVDEALMNHLVNVPVRLVFLYFLFDLYVLAGMELDSESFPSLATISLHIGASVLIDDTWFYWSHRLLHHPAIYKYIHKQHHRFIHTRGYAVDFCHPVEDVFSNTISTIIGPLLLQSHLSVVFTYSFLKMYQSIEAHSGYIVPFPLSVWSISWPVDWLDNGRHAYHHSHNKGNYGGIFCFWDRLMGTDQDFEAWRAKQAAAKRAEAQGRRLLDSDSRPGTVEWEKVVGAPGETVRLLVTEKAVVWGTSCVDLRNIATVAVVSGGRLVLRWVPESKMDQATLHVSKAVFRVESEREAAGWVRAIRWSVSGQQHKLEAGFPDDPSSDDDPKRAVYVIRNPVSGVGASGPAAKVLSKLLDLEGSPVSTYSVVTTTHEGHARELASTLDIDEIDAIVCIGGDGLVHEVANGLLSRADWPDDDDDGQSLRRLALGVIPAGSGNGLAMSFGCRPNAVVRAALRVLQGRTRPFDAMRVRIRRPRGWETETGEHLKKSEDEDGREHDDNAHEDEHEHVVNSLVSVSFGIIADVDRESERFRWMGALRFTVVALMKIIVLPVVKCEVWCEYDGDGSSGRSSGGSSSTGGNDGAGAARQGQRQRSRSRSKGRSNSGGMRLVPVRDNAFIATIVCNLPFITHDLKMVPFASAADGRVSVGLLPLIQRWKLLCVFLLAETGAHMPRLGTDAGYGTMGFSSRRCELRPLLRDDDEAQRHWLDVDGEFHRSVVGMRVHIEPRPSALRVLA